MAEMRVERTTISFRRMNITAENCYEFENRLGEG